MTRRTETTLPPANPPYVAPGVDPAKIGAVDAYRLGVMSRKGTLTKADMPLNPERPPIPLLSGGPPPGSPGMATMADFARAERAAAAAPAEPAPGPSIIQEAAPQAATRGATFAQPRPTAASLGLTPADLLPESAKQDPDFIQGYGCEFAANQPMMAAKYGVLRGGQFIAPQRLGGAQKRSLSPETIQGLETLKKLQDGSAAPGLDADEAASRRAVENGTGGAAARVGNLLGDNSVKAPTEDEKTRALQKAIEQMDAFEFNQWRQLAMREILHGEDQREIIEKRLQPLDIGELITYGVIRQTIPIVPGKYEITLQSFDGQVELALKRLVMMESRSVDVGEQYLLDKHSFMSLAAGLHKVNNKEFPKILDDKGNFDDNLFFIKFNQVMKLPIHMLASIGVNQMWFEMRVRRLYKASEVGNG